MSSKGEELLKKIKEHESIPDECRMSGMIYKCAEGLGKSNVLQRGAAYSYWVSLAYSLMSYGIYDLPSIAEVVNSFHEEEEIREHKFLWMKYKWTHVVGVYTLPGTSINVKIDYNEIHGD